MAGKNALPERLEALVAARYAMTSRTRSRAYAAVCAEAGVQCEESPADYWTEVDHTADLIHRAAKWYSHQRGAVRYAMASVLHGGGHEFLDYWSFSVAGRTLFRELGVHCHGNEEGTLALLQFYQANSDPQSLPEVANRFHTIYRSLKTQHWLTVDTSYYPFAAAAAIQMEEPSLVLARWLALTEAMRRAGLRSKKERFQAALILTPSDGPAPTVAASACALAKAVRGTGLSTRAVALTDIAFLQRAGADPDRTAALWYETARAFQKGPLRMNAQDSASCAALLVLESTLEDGPLREHLIQAKIIADILRVVHRIRGEKLSGSGWDDNGDGWSGDGGNGNGGNGD